MHDAREYDAVVASGEQVTSGLLAIALQAIGIQARSWQGWQIPIRTSDAHASARILDIDGTEIIKRFERPQGSRGDRRLPGHPCRRPAASPRSAAAAPTPRRWRSRPRSRPTAATSTPTSTASTPPTRAWCRRRERLDKVAFEEMLELASQGAKVLQVRSVELGMVHNMPVFVRSSFDKPEDIDPHGTPPGTLICSEEEIMESHVVTGIAFSKDEAQISVRQIEDKPGVAAAIFGPLAEANINVDMIVQNVSEDGKTTDLTFTVPASDYRPRPATPSPRRKDKIGYARLDSATDVAKVSVIGIGMRSHAGVAAQAFKALAAAQHQHPRHHHLRDQVLGADRRRLYRTGGAHAAYALRARPGLERIFAVSAVPQALVRQHGVVLPDRCWQAFCLAKQASIRYTA